MANHASAEDFVRAWQSSSSLAEVAEKLGSTTNNVNQRGYVLRKKGVELKSMKPGRRPEDVARLNAIIRGEVP